MKKKAVKRNRILHLLIAAFILYGLISLVKLQFDVTAKKEELADLQEQCSSQQAQNQEIATIASDGSENDYIAKIARDQLNYVYPDERIYVDISGR